MTYATVADVAAELGQPVPTDQLVVDRWTRWLERVEDAIRARIADLDARVANADLDARTVARVEAATVARKADNPRGLTTVQVSVDDGSTTETRDRSQSDGLLRITDEDWALLLPPALSGSTRPGFAPDRRRWSQRHPWWP